MNDRISELEEQRAEALERHGLWKSLLDHPGWKRFVQERQEQMNIRQTVVCTTPITAAAGILAQEFFKGQFAGIKEDLEYVQTQYEVAARELAILNQHLENESETEKRISGAAKSRVDTSEHFGE